MRIIAGQWRGRNLVAPTGAHTRPTSERAREALFSMLQSRLGSFEDLHILDICAGTGALGLEAVSRGAAQAVFVENHAAALKALRTNIAQLKAEKQTYILAQDASQLGKAPQAFHLAMLDPPYDSSLAPQILERLDQGGWLEAGALVSVETAENQDLCVPRYENLVKRTHGKAALHLLRYMPQG